MNAAVGLALFASLGIAAPVSPAMAPASQPAQLAATAPAAAVRSDLTPEAPDSPRASVRAFLQLARGGDDRRAARYLALRPDERERGPELARRLQAVLDRHLDLALDAVSPFAEGNGRDDLPPGVDLIGQIHDGKDGRVFVARARDGDGTFWEFSEQTVSQIDGWYDALPDRWARDWLPEPLQHVGPLDLMWWQWLALPALLLLSLLGGRLLGSASAHLLRRLARRAPTPWDLRLSARVVPALTLLWATAIAALLLRRLALLPAAHAEARSTLGGIATFAVFWALWRSIDVWNQFLLERPWATDNPSARSLLLVSRNVVKAFVGVTGVVATLAVFGYPVTTVLAGLGIGGVAVAFGAQKTIENLFGSIAIAADQPFRLGDFVKVEDFSGTVEHVGMRSTRFRTPDRTLISMPNGKLADLRIEDFAPRDRMRFATTVGLGYATSEAQLRAVVDGIERLLRATPEVWPDLVVARLAAFSAASFDVEVLCWFATSDDREFRRLRQETLFGIMRVVAEAGASFARPICVVPLAAGGAAATDARTHPR